MNAVTCPFCGLEWFNFFDDIETCTKCIDPAKRPKGAGKEQR